MKYPMQVKFAAERHTICSVSHRLVIKTCFFKTKNAGLQDSDQDQDTMSREAGTMINSFVKNQNRSKGDKFQTVTKHCTSVYSLLLQCKLENCLQLRTEIRPTALGLGLSLGVGGRRCVVGVRVRVDLHL